MYFSLILGGQPEGTDDGWLNGDYAIAEGIWVNDDGVVQVLS